MPETYTNPPVRIHRVNTRRRNLQTLLCPLDPELLVAEFASELPPDVAQAVREHIAVCETCGNRSRALRAPYELLASLGTEPVTHVPDLRDSVRAHIRSNRLTKGMLRAAGNLGRGGAFGVSALIGLIAVAAFLIAGVLYNVNAGVVSRSSNALTNVPAAAVSGALLVETNKLVTVRDGTGDAWQVAEIITVSQRTGSVLRSLPRSSDSLQIAHPDQLPAAVSFAPDGRTVYEITALNAAHQQALVAFDTVTGDVRYIVTLKYPGGSFLTPGNQADALAVSPDGATLYAGLFERDPAAGGTRALVIDAKTGAVERKLFPAIESVIPMPPPPGSLPASAFPSIIPKLTTAGYTMSLGASGELVVSPDGRWVFDVLILSDGQGPKYAVVRRIDPVTGELKRELAIPGSFVLARLAISSPGELATAQAEATATVAAQATAIAQATATPGATPPATINAPPMPTPQLYLVAGSPEAQCFVLDPGATGPTLTGTISLGGPAAPPNTTFSGDLSVSPSADGSALYVTQNVSARNGLITGRDLWELDVRNMGIISHRVDTDAADAVQANPVLAGDIFLLRGGNVLIISSDFSNAPASWLNLNNGQIVAFIGAT